MSYQQEPMSLPGEDSGGLSPEELDQQAAAELPDREAMTLIDVLPIGNPYPLEPAPVGPFPDPAPLPMPPVEEPPTM